VGATASELARLLEGREHVLDGAEARPYLTDATETRGVRGTVEAVALPGDAEEARAVLEWCYSHDVAVVPRGGGSGYAGGAVPDGGVVISTERLRSASLDPELWRAEFGAGVTTAHVRRWARESGLWLPLDPGAGEQSCIGGNAATNAGGPHAFKYGTTRAWITALEAVLAPGELVQTGGFTRKDVASYDLTGLLCGSEGTLGLITSVRLRLIPPPEAQIPVAAVYPDASAGCAAVLSVLGSGLQPATLEYLDGGALNAARAGYPADLPDGAGFLVISQADGHADSARRLADELREALGEGALAVSEPDPEELARWREGVSHAVIAQRGGKVSEDVAVPANWLEDAIRATVEIGRRHDLPALSWGHAGDGNLHSTFLVAADDREGLRRADAARAELFELAVRLGGTISGEHGLGTVKDGPRYRSPGLTRAHTDIKRALDPKGLLNPGKKR
jgi:FAD/FMN-containing dehydrogenase